MIWSHSRYWLEISAYIHHESGLNWLKNFSHSLISGSVAPSSMQKLWTPLAAIFVEKKFEKIFGVVLDPFELPHERNFWYLEKIGVFKFFERVRNPEPVIHAYIYFCTIYTNHVFIALEGEFYLRTCQVTGSVE